MQLNAACKTVIFERGDNLKIFEAMLYKRDIKTTCNIDVSMLDTSEDGIVLTVDKDLVDVNILGLITDFVNENQLSLLLESGRYFISAGSLAPWIQYFS